MLATILRRARLGLVAVILLPMMASATAAPQPRPDQQSAAAAFQALVEARRDGSTRGREAALAELVTLSAQERRDLIERLAVPGTPDGIARAALDVLGRAGTPRDPAIALRFLRAGLEVEVEDTIASIATRDPRTLNVLDEILRDLPTEARAILVRAVERVGTPAAAGWLGRCIERASDVRGEALARLGRLAQELGKPPPADVYTAVRNVLAGADSESLRAAIIAAGRLEDADAIPHLIAILRTGAPGSRADAKWSLGLITGLRLGDQIVRWDAWYATEQEWWREESESAFTALDSGDRAERVTALLAIGKLHAWRHKLASEVAPALQDPDPEVARLAAQVLGRMNSRYVGAALARAMERPEAEVVHEAWRTLRSTTRKDLPSDPAAWRALFPH